MLFRLFVTIGDSLTVLQSLHYFTKFLFAGDVGKTKPQKNPSTVLTKINLAAENRISFYEFTYSSKQQTQVT
jgi:hypothetical protein